MVCLIIFIGIPGAGKTTLCDKLALHLHESYNIKIFCYDKILSEFSKQSRNSVFEAIANYVKLCKCDKRNIIFIDDNMYYKSMRKEYFQLAKELHISYLQIYTKTDLDTACERNRKRKHVIPTDIIKNMFYKLEEPTDLEYTIILNASTEFSINVITRIRDKIIEAFDRPFTPNSFNYKIPEQSVKSYYQTLDLILRKTVRAKCIENPHLSSKYNSIRKEIYKIVKADFKQTYGEEDICKMFDCYQ